MPSYQVQGDRIQLEPICFSSWEVIIEGQMLLGILRSSRNWAPQANDFPTVGIDIQYQFIKKETVQFTRVQGSYFVQIGAGAAVLIYSFIYLFLNKNRNICDPKAGRGMMIFRCLSTDTLKSCISTFCDCGFLLYFYSTW